MYILDIEPFPCPRPKIRVVGNGKSRVGMAYYPSDYTKKKQDLAFLIKSLSIPKEDHSGIEAVFYIPYPKSTPKKDLIEGSPRRKRPDADNYVKAVLDAMQDAGVFVDDAGLSDITARKRNTTNATGRIEFKLY